MRRCHELPRQPEPAASTLARDARMKETLDHRVDAYDQHCVPEAVLTHEWHPIREDETLILDCTAQVDSLTSPGQHPGRRANRGVGEHWLPRRHRGFLHSGARERVDERRGDHFRDNRQRLLQKGNRINVLGLTSKANSGDLGNRKVIDIIHELGSDSVDLLVRDPPTKADEAVHEYGVRRLPWNELAWTGFRPWRDDAHRRPRVRIGRRGARRARVVRVRASLLQPEAVVLSSGAPAGTLVERPLAGDGNAGPIPATPVEGVRTPSSLSDLTKSAAKSGKTAHFSPYFCTSRTTIRLKSMKNCARLPFLSLRPIKSDRLLALPIPRYREIELVLRRRDEPRLAATTGTRA